MEDFIPYFDALVFLNQIDLLGDKHVTVKTVFIFYKILINSKIHIFNDKYYFPIVFRTLVPHTNYPLKHNCSKTTIALLQLMLKLQQN